MKQTRFSNDQNRPSNSDLFLLLLNNTSRSLRKQFQSQQNRSSNIMAHIYKINIHQNLTNSARESMEDNHPLLTRRVN